MIDSMSAMSKSLRPIMEQRKAETLQMQNTQKTLEKIPT